MTTNTNTAPADIYNLSLKALTEYLKDCDEHAIEPDVGGAFANAFRAGAALSATQQPADERVAFEQWMRDRFPDHSLAFVNGRYTYSPPQRMWETWQARSAAQQPEPPNVWADLWYFVMDEAPLEFEQIVTKYSPRFWHQEAHKLMRTKYPASAPKEAKVQVERIGEIRVGNLTTMNQDDYSGLGAWWVQLRIGPEFDEVLARVYGPSPDEVRKRANTLASRLQQPAPREPLTAREIELIDGMIEVQLHHANRSDNIGNRPMAEKQKAWNMERVELLKKLKASYAPREPLTEEQIAHLNTVRIFSRVDPDVFRWIVYRVEYEHRISDRMRLESSGIKRLSDEVSTKGKP